MSKVTVIGAGNVGATVADVLAHKDFVKEVVLVDIRGDFAKGKALDIWQQAPIGNYSTRLKGTDNYKDTKGSDVVVITAEMCIRDRCDALHRRPSFCIRRRCLELYGSLSGF